MMMGNSIIAAARREAAGLDSATRDYPSLSNYGGSQNGGGLFSGGMGGLPPPAVVTTSPVSARKPKL